MDGIEQGEVQGDATAQLGGETPGPNPAWNDVLGVLPEQFHSVVTPHFQKWDQAAQSRIEAANARVAEFEPYAAFAQHGIEPSEIENGLRLMYEINNDPKRVWEALAQTYGLGANSDNSGQGNEGDGAPDPSNFQDPRFDQLQQGIELVSQVVLREQQAKANAEADMALDTELNQLREKHGDYNERFVLAMMQNGMTGEQAVQEWQSIRNDTLQNNPRPFAPNVMGNSGGGSGYPSQAIDPTKLSGKETRNLVAEMLAAEFGRKS